MKAPMMISVVMNLANILLSSVLIYGFRLDLGFIHWTTPAYGVTGAALGLTLARMLDLSWRLSCSKKATSPFPGHLAISWQWTARKWAPSCSLVFRQVLNS
jgi:Na+-driven multidrug efflux pump